MAEHTDNIQREFSKKYRSLVMLAGLASVATAVVLITVKAIIWFYSGSTSIFASLTDSMFDALASFINLLALRYSLTPPDNDHRFGHYKSQSLASLAQAAFIGGSAVLLILHGINRFKYPQVVEHVDLAIYVSIIAMVFTLALVLFQSFVFRRTQSEAIGADRFHYLSDIGLNLGVLIALVLSQQGYLWADGLFAAIIGLFILKGAWSIGSHAIDTLLDKSLSATEMLKISQTINSVPGIISVHDLKTHRAGPKVFIQCHVVLKGCMKVCQAHRIVNEVEYKLEKLFSETEITIHMEPDIPETYETVVFKS
ncbi:MAG: cation diffusion facilitator family transporter [Succinatimonas sp.]|nr:cation diffusion facilitator family transporter [Succinatimonas sp.]